MFTDIIKVLIASFFCIAISVFIFIVLYITHEWAKYLFYKCFPKLYEIREAKRQKKRMALKEKLINEYLENL